MRILLIIALALACFPASHADEPEGSTILLRHTEGGRTTDFRYIQNAETARLDRLGEPTVPPSPWNLIDRESGALTILRPHNQSISTLSTDAFDRQPANPHAAPDMPPGIGASPTAVGIPATPTAPGDTPAPAGIGPDPAILPEGIEMPELPQIPSPVQPPAIPGVPGGMPPGMPGAIPGGVPPMGFGDLPGMGRDGGELTAHEESREIHGHTCTRHTLTLGSSLELELWLAESSDLSPFYLLTWDGPPHFGHNDLLQDWPHLIRKAGKFPLLATLREAERQDDFHDFHEELETPETKPDRPEIARWEIISIEPATPDPNLFDHPENFFQTDRTP